VRRSRVSAIATIVTTSVAAMLVLAVPQSGAAKLNADYRFEHNFKSSVGSPPNLQPEGPPRVCPCARFVRAEIGGSKQGAWKWLEGDGLKLRKAGKALGHNGHTYTFVMLVNLDSVDGYRKLIDFDNLQADQGWYVYNSALYPYNLSDFDYSSQLVTAGHWRQIAVTRDKNGVVRGYVGDKKVGMADDPGNDEALGGAAVLHFLIDDAVSGGSEATGGLIARLRIWDDALSSKQIKNLGH
jgi:hypothetical protein